MTRQDMVVCVLVPSCRTSPAAWNVCCTLHNVLRMCPLPPVVSSQTTGTSQAQVTAVACLTFEHKRALQVTLAEAVRVPHEPLVC